jgi:hypothetical protein
LAGRDDGAERLVPATRPRPSTPAGSIFGFSRRRAVVCPITDFDLVVTDAAAAHVGQLRDAGLEVLCV